MTKGTHLLRSALLALLALAVISGGSLAAGDLFDDDYKDCPHKTRLRDGQISDLSVARDSDDEDEVNVSWAATDPATWGLGPNAYSTSLVVILDDGSLNTETLSLGSKKTTFDGVDTGREVTVQMAIVVDTADGKYLISDILEKRINQSLTEPSFSSAWYRVRTQTATTNAFTLPTRTGKASDFAVNADAIDAGMMYYIGYNENFANYVGNDALDTSPVTARLRIGLAHSSNETDDERDDVDFDAYVIRIMDEDGDVVSEGDDVTTVASNYGNDSVTVSYDHDANPAAGVTDAPPLTLAVPNKLFLYSLDAEPVPNAGPSPAKGTFGTDGYVLHNVRINDGGDITPAAHATAADATALGGRDATPLLTPTYLSMVKVDGYATGGYTFTGPAAATDTTGTIAENTRPDDTVFAEPPNEHRNLPIDTMDSDVSYTIEAWAINDDNEVISPVAKLKVRPHNTDRNAAITDYRNAAVAGSFITTEFTVLK